ncbi:MAG: T9SS type A sorting domain-containing protein [Candidatus Delongbacteria bacterium]|nr:T9SS type A sorting domain-containing protein [Candidatus Delongbacteria bacterium]
MKKLILFILISMIYLIAGYQWGEPIVICSHPTADIKEHNMCIDKNGTIHVVWNERYTSTYSQIFYSYSQDEGDSWSPAYNVSQSDTSLLRDPAIASDNNGNLYVAYDWNASYPILMLKTFDGISWSEPDRLDSNTFYFKSKLIVDNDDRVYHFWDLFGVPYFRYIDVSDSVWTEIDSTITDFYFKDIIVDNQNNLHATGSTNALLSEHTYTAYVTYKKQEDLWSKIEVIDSVGTLTASVGERICLSEDNNLHIASREQENYNTWRTFYQFKHLNDSIWSEPDIVSDFTYPNVVNITTDENNRVHIFQQYLGIEANICDFRQLDDSWVLETYNFGDLSTGNPVVKSYNENYYIVFRDYDFEGADYLYFIKGSYVGIYNNNEQSDMSYKLEFNYPNPFNPTTNINYSINAISKIEISVFNSKGELVNNLVNEKQSKGNHTVTFDASKLNSGVYYYRLKIDGMVKETKKMLYLR